MNIYNCGYIAWDTYKIFIDGDKGFGSWFWLGQQLYSFLFFKVLLKKLERGKNLYALGPVVKIFRACSFREARKMEGASYKL